MTSLIDPRATSALRSLETIASTSVPEVMDRVLEVVREVTDEADVACFRQLEGPTSLEVTRFDHRGHPRTREMMQRVGAAPPAEQLGRLGTGAWAPERIRRFETTGFFELGALFDEAAIEQSQYFRTFYDPAGVVDQLRLLVVHGGCYVGWIGAHRRIGESRFTARDRRRFAPLVEPLIRAVSMVARIEDDSAGMGDLVVRPNGHIEYASCDAARWIADEDVRRRIVGAVRFADTNRNTLPRLSVHPYVDATLLRLDGDCGVRYLVGIRPRGPLRVPPSAILSSTLLDVAELASSGASVRDIARIRGAAETTVKGQLKRVYQRLGVRTRVELVHAMLDRRPRTRLEPF